MAESLAATRPKAQAFAALHNADYRTYFVGWMLTMMGDNVEHVISYWVLFQAFHSPALAGFAVISHWAPYLLFGMYFGALADRFDCRKLIAVSQLTYLSVSLCWSVLFFTGTLQVWQAVILLTMHGVGSVVGSPATQLILHDMVGREHLQSAVRMNATARNLGFLVGPGVGGLMLMVVGPGPGMLFNSLVYLPLMVWLVRVPYTGHGTQAQGRERRSGLGFRDALATLRAVSGHRPVVAMLALAATSSFFIGSGMQAQMPEFAQDLGVGEAGIAYSALVAANAVGGVLGGLLLDGLGLFATRARTALLLAIAWALAILAFAVTPSYPVALVLLVLIGMLNLAFSAMSQTLVQLEAPPEVRGRVIGLFNMGQLGLRVGSGITVGVVGNAIGIHWSLGLSAALMLLFAVRILGYLGPSKRVAAVARAS
ncbi:MAG TPA: MFS transporter [Chloroflexota bacterium]|nr:MFS transporter [Chloroflexota bacterium]